jgi:hypothetical protein
LAFNSPLFGTPWSNFQLLIILIGFVPAVEGPRLVTDHVPRSRKCPPFGSERTAILMVGGQSNAGKRAPKSIVPISAHLLEKNDLAAAASLKATPRIRCTMQSPDTNFGVGSGAYLMGQRRYGKCASGSMTVWSSNGGQCLNGDPTGPLAVAGNLDWRFKANVWAAA